MNTTTDKRGGHWPARASQKFGGRKPKYKSPNREKKAPQTEKKTSRQKKRASLLQHGKILYDFLGGASAYSCPPPCGHPFFVVRGGGGSSPPQKKPGKK